jgi:hypothetical protein
MKKITLLFTFLIGAGFSYSQSILFVDDNDNITDNSDTTVYALQNTSYNNFDYYNVADSTSTPSLTLLNNYDLVIWYASTDGAGLGFWDNGVQGNIALTDYLIGGGRLWLIGSDLLYAGGYSTPHTFASGDFMYDFIGLESYNVQSYGDDGSTGVAQVDLISGAPSYFPTTLDWIFPTAWWFDGIDSRSGSIDLYEMGPSSYTLYQEVSMTHFKDGQTNALSTYFDPALISNYALRRDFMENTIFYILNFDLGIDEKEKTIFSIFPNPTQGNIILKMDDLKSNFYSITSNSGIKVQDGFISGKTVNVNNLESGIYFLTIDGKTQRFLKL